MLIRNGFKRDWRSSGITNVLLRFKERMPSVRISASRGGSLDDARNMFVSPGMISTAEKTLFKVKYNDDR